MVQRTYTDSNEDDRIKALRAADAQATRNATAPFRPPGQSGIAGGETASSISGKKRRKARKMTNKKLRKEIKRYVAKNANNGGDITTAVMQEALRQAQARGRSSTLLNPDVATTTVGDAAQLEKELSSLLLRKAVASGHEAQEIAARLQVVGDKLTMLKLRAFNSGLL